LQKWTVAATGVAATALMLLPGWDMRWLAVCSAFLVAAGVSATVAHLKGRKTSAAAGVGSVIVLGSLLALFRVLAPVEDLAAPASSAIWGILFTLTTLCAVGPLLLVALAGSFMRAKPDSLWVGAKPSPEQSPNRPAGLIQHDRDQSGN
jgi:hypothetical protein